MASSAITAFGVDPTSADATPLLHWARASHGADIILAAQDLGIFAALANGPLSVTEIRTIARLERRPMTVLLTALLALGVCRRIGDGRIEVPKDLRAYIIPDSPTDLSAYMRLLTTGDQFRRFTQSFQSNAPIQRPDGDNAVFVFGRGLVSALDDPQTARQLSEALMPHARAAAPYLIARVLCGASASLLDVGAGAGLYSIAFLLAYPNLRATVVDHPNILPLAREQAEKYGVASRLSFINADMFSDELPEADLVLLSNVLHDWDEPDAATLLRRMAQLVAPSGTLLIHDSFLAEGLDGPVDAALHSVAIFALTFGRLYGTFEVIEWLRSTDLAVGVPQPTWGGMSVLAAHRKEEGELV